MPYRPDEPTRKLSLPQFKYLGEMISDDFHWGFRYLEIASPTEQMPSNRVIAAVFEIDACNRIVRVYDPMFNRPGYVHQRYGVIRRGKLPAWHAVQLIFPDSKMAIRSWQLGKDNPTLDDPTFPVVDEQAPKPREY